MAHLVKLSALTEELVTSLATYSSDVCILRILITHLHFRAYRGIEG